MALKSIINATYVSNHCKERGVASIKAELRRRKGEEGQSSDTQDQSMPSQFNDPNFAAYTVRIMQGTML
ncbi:hypothetical protein TanjilG_28268 [Lupinus angustifolius]|uniref:Uncharacterized protein n=1 Tax=Lupinus angustifolius TaxID=3871 RepID=A0A1J7GGB0_LUPAN|nr:hypothetical protein TanjilG_28268 [Lupinus angustifolius]